MPCRPMRTKARIHGSPILGEMRRDIDRHRHGSPILGEMRRDIDRHRRHPQVIDDPGEVWGALLPLS
jgi:hypothetical protein